MPATNPEYDYPYGFFIAKLIVPEDVVTNVLSTLNAVHGASMTVESQQYELVTRVWKIRLHCRDYRLLQTLGSMHNRGSIEEFRII